MFAYDAELDLALGAIDLFIIDGWKALLKIALALLILNQNALEGKNYEESVIYLNALLSQSIDIQILFKTANSFHFITNEVIRQIESKAFDVNQTLDLGVAVL